MTEHSRLYESFPHCRSLSTLNGYHRLVVSNDRAGGMYASSILRYFHLVQSVNRFENTAHSDKKHQGLQPLLHFIAHQQVAARIGVIINDTCIPIYIRFCLSCYSHKMDLHSTTTTCFHLDRCENTIHSEH